jgi:uncharacterized membrane protein YkvA (DUF1232 family)
MGDAKGEQDSGRQQSVIALIPRVAKLVYHLARDPRVPWTAKAALGGMALYLASPIDLIPDWIPGAGYLDDILLAGIVINYVFAKVPEEVIIEHWGEDVELLKKMRRRRKPRKKEP